MDVNFQLDPFLSILILIEIVSVGILASGFLYSPNSVAFPLFKSVFIHWGYARGHDGQVVFSHCSAKTLMMHWGFY